MAESRTIPAIFRIDVEPDETSFGVSDPWHGFGAMLEVVDSIREPLSGISGAPAIFHWMFRMDPAVAAAFGRADYVVRRYPDLIERIRSVNDVFGIHVHQQRWDDGRRAVYADYADAAWGAHCLASSCEAFQESMGEPVLRLCGGGFFTTPEMLVQAAQLGVRVDLTVEPGVPPLEMDGSFGAGATAPSADFQNCPRYPYYPAPDDLSRELSPGEAAWGSVPRILMVPMTAYFHEPGLPYSRRIYRTLTGRPKRMLPLSMWRMWRSPKAYWDLVERAVDLGPARYFASAVRTDSSGSLTFQRVKAILEYLPRHPIARRLRTLDALAAELRALVPSHAAAVAEPAGLPVCVG